MAHPQTPNKRYTGNFFTPVNGNNSNTLRPMSAFPTSSNAGTSLPPLSQSIGASSFGNPRKRLSHHEDDDTAIGGKKQKVITISDDSDTDSEGNEISNSMAASFYPGKSFGIPSFPSSTKPLALDDDDDDDDDEDEDDGNATEPDDPSPGKSSNKETAPPPPRPTTDNKIIHTIPRVAAVLPMHQTRAGFYRYLMTLNKTTIASMLLDHVWPPVPAVPNAQVELAHCVYCHQPFNSLDTETDKCRVEHFRELEDDGDWAEYSCCGEKIESADNDYDCHGPIEEQMGKYCYEGPHRAEYIVREEWQKDGDDEEEEEDEDEDGGDVVWWKEFRKDEDNLCKAKGCASRAAREKAMREQKKGGRRVHW